VIPGQKTCLGLRLRESDEIDAIVGLKASDASRTLDQCLAPGKVGDGGENNRMAGRD
jgi:hypothetical protein